MATKVIEISLDPASIDRAIKEVKAYRTRIQEKLKVIRKRVAEEIQWTAADGFSRALTSDILPKGGKPDPCTVTVTLQERGDVHVVIAHGEQAVFIEFGAGIYHNGSGSPHPYVNGAGGLASEEVAGFTIGSYGKGQGGYKNTWALPKELWTEHNENGKPIAKLTHGTPAQMPMYHGVQAAVFRIADIVREELGDD